jgi:hypothetical protein
MPGCTCVTLRVCTSMNCASQGSCRMHSLMVRPLCASQRLTPEDQGDPFQGYQCLQGWAETVRASAAGEEVLVVRSTC